jgi:hypothetical protein
MKIGLNRFCAQIENPQDFAITHFLKYCHSSNDRILRIVVSDSKAASGLGEKVSTTSLA